MNNDFVKIESNIGNMELTEYMYLYDDDYNLIKEVSRYDGNVIDYFYINGVMIEERHSFSNNILFSVFLEYDNDTNLIKVKSNHCNLVKILEYDDKNREIKKINMDKSTGIRFIVSQTEYGDNGKISRVIYGENDIGVYTYDKKDRVISYDRNNIESIKYKYDIRDNCIEKIDSECTLYFEHDEFNNHIATRVKYDSGKPMLIARHKYKRKEDK